MNRRKALLFILLPLPLLAMQFGVLSKNAQTIPPVTDYEKLRLEQNAQRKIMDAILIYVRPDDEPAKQFAKTLREAGIPQLPGVSR